ncbi:vanadium-dependent haloperoxidase [Mucilaginibacter sp. ZT4R22]|uniref:Vanadium-dependent haloperoxidase n=1 Tax=Mucilaginibacter pankratovii TaxID=2772110 RepID=A0ABR7WJG1_9SPHI|nr:vanadium-dependent haloperoxidase [Mucilaginibacter pankratovii]MBD1362460.1 vanadium-dependent haloperoxidase [Mucilaginibacter pankratovii]
MKNLYYSIAFILLISVNLGCRPAKITPKLTSADITKVINQMMVEMIHDVTNPPLAARFFAYTCISGYEVLSQNDPKMQQLDTILNGYPAIKAPSVTTGFDTRLSAVFAMVATASKLQPSGAALKVFEQKLIDSCINAGFSQGKIDSSLKYGQQISAQLLAYAKSDGYNKISNYKRYTLKGTPGSWDPTPPAYIAAVEPYFRTVRPLTLKSSGQFIPVPPVPFSTDKTSAFYKYLLQCHSLDADSLSADQRTVAAFWDCNPFAVQDNGHMQIGLKKISPGAHWMGITGIACKKAGVDFERAMRVNTMVAIGLMDSFISCWNEKYKTNRIRPETAIHKYMDARWHSFLQTPPFPEYLSGHSFISSTAAAILTSFFGDNFKYTDDVEVAFGIPPREFSSFNKAAVEAGYSRLLGGIHFQDGISNGKMQGELVGAWVLGKFTGKTPVTK